MVDNYHIDEIQHSYLVVDFIKCTEENRSPDDPPCADMSEINKWLEKNISQEEFNRMAKEIRDDDYGPDYEDFGPVEGYKDYY